MAPKITQRSKNIARPERKPRDRVPRTPRLGPEERRIRAAVDFVKKRAPKMVVPRAGVVLGSGLGAALAAMQVDAAIPYSDIPGFLPSTVAGHAGRLVLGSLAGVPIVVMQGRVHLYEGHAVADVVLPARVLVALGAKSLVITNAAGGVNATFVSGDLMLISDQLNLTGRNPLHGPNEAALGARFPDMTEAYSAEYRAFAHLAAERLGFKLREGVYAGLLGPSYETPAEVRMMRTLGADAVGMSTVLEVIAARHMGAKILGISCISNLAAGLSGAPLTHEEVTATAKAVESRLFQLVAEVLPRIVAAG